MRQALGPGALGRPGVSWWRGRWEGGSGWGRHVNSKKITKKKKKRNPVFKVKKKKNFKKNFYII